MAEEQESSVCPTILYVRRIHAFSKGINTKWTRLEFELRMLLSLSVSIIVTLYAYLINTSWEFRTGYWYFAMINTIGGCSDDDENGFDGCNGIVISSGSVGGGSGDDRLGV